MTKSQFHTDDYKPLAKAPFDVEEVLAKMTLSEKCRLLSGKDIWHTHEFPHLGVPSLRTSDGPTGVRGTRFFDGVRAACFPCGTALGATWDQPLLREAGETMGDEAKAKGVHTILGPTTNMQRSPLGGRGFESFAEDPVLSGLSAAAVINGIQTRGVQTTMKHFVCNDQEHERNAVDAMVTERALREIYLMPFQLAIRDANPGSIMTGYNKVNGTHVSQNPKLLKDVLRDEWKWDGLIMSDWFGVYSTGDSVAAGLDLEMPGPTLWRGLLLERAVITKSVSLVEVDNRARSVLKFVQKCFTESGVPEGGEEITRDTPETRALLRKIAADSAVLLKNEGSVLPLSKSKTTAVIGPNAKVTTLSGGGSASLRPYYAVSPFDGISAKTASEPLYALGVNTFKELPLIGKDLVDEKGRPGFRVNSYDAHHSEKERKLLDSRYLDESYMLMADFAPNGDKAFYVDAEAYLTPEKDGVYDFGLVVSGTATLYVDDKLIVDNEKKQTKGNSFFDCGTIEETGSIELKAGKTYKIAVYFGSAVTSRIAIESGVTIGGGLRIGYKRQTKIEDDIAEAVEIAKSVDQVVLALGLNLDWESEGYDRDHMDYPPNVDKLVAAVMAVNPNTVVVNQSGTPVAMPWHASVPAIVQAWYGGNETGNGIADVVFGDVNPSGKLPLSWPHKVEDNPAYFNYRSENGRTLYGEDVYVGYRYYETVAKDVLFPFGHGLSYSKFALKNLEVSATSETLSVSVDVSNTGSIDGSEVVQVYIAQKNPKIRRPIKELKGFAKVAVKAGKSESVKVEIPLKYATSYWDEYHNDWISEEGEYSVLVGTSSASIQAKAPFTVEKTSHWRGL